MELQRNCQKPDHMRSTGMNGQWGVWHWGWLTNCRLNRGSVGEAEAKGTLFRGTAPGRPPAGPQASTLAVPPLCHLCQCTACRWHCQHFRGLFRTMCWDRGCSGVCLISGWVVEALHEQKRALPVWKDGLRQHCCGVRECRCAFTGCTTATWQSRIKILVNK